MLESEQLRGVVVVLAWRRDMLRIVLCIQVQNASRSSSPTSGIFSVVLACNSSWRLELTSKRAEKAGQFLILNRRDRASFE